MNRSNGPPTALVVGYGSIGRRHARALVSVVPCLVIVNRREGVRAQAARDYPSARVIADLETLEGNGLVGRSAVAVIASWGPSHAALFHALADRGVRRILCEKPMAASVQDAWAMAERAEREGIFLGLNHTIRYARLVPALLQLAVEHRLGEPVAVVLEGGAACLLTNGIHWIDFATELFGLAPQQVLSTAYGEAINPRSADLLLYGGTAVWSFGDGREATISFSNRSSVRPHAAIYYRNAVITAGYTAGGTDEHIHVVARRRDPAAVAQYPAVTRTGPARELVFEGCLPGVRSLNQGLSAAAQELVGGSVPTCSATIGATAVSACIGALIAAREGRAVDLPIAPTSALGREQWPIS